MKTTPRLTIEIDQETKNKFKARASNDGKSLKEKIIELITEYIQKPIDF